MMIMFSISYWLKKDAGCNPMVSGRPLGVGKPLYPIKPIFPARLIQEHLIVNRFKKLSSNICKNEKSKTPKRCITVDYTYFVYFTTEKTTCQGFSVFCGDCPKVVGRRSNQNWDRYSHLSINVYDVFIRVLNVVDIDCWKNGSPNTLNSLWPRAGYIIC